MTRSRSSTVVNSDLMPNGIVLSFTQGGWERDEKIAEAVEREAMEEAGVGGEVQMKLGIYEFRSKSQSNITHEGHMFPMFVTMQYEDWPEKQSRLRNWVCM